MFYAYVQRGTVLIVERRLSGLPYTDGLQPLVDAKLYNGALLPYFKPVPQKLWDKVRPGWLYADGRGFFEPQPYTVNPETGEIYLPEQISAADFYKAMTAAQQMEAAATQAGRMITDLELQRLAQGRQITELELQLLEVQAIDRV